MKNNNQAYIIKKLECDCLLKNIGFIKHPDCKKTHDIEYINHYITTHNILFNDRGWRLFHDFLE